MIPVADTALPVILLNTATIPYIAAITKATPAIIQVIGQVKIARLSPVCAAVAFASATLTAPNIVCFARSAKL